MRYYARVFHFQRRTCIVGSSYPRVFVECIHFICPPGSCFVASTSLRSMAYADPTFVFAFSSLITSPEASCKRKLRDRQHDAPTTLSFMMGPLT